MKIQCNACEMAEATVLCCADDAALCLACDERIHAANKLASKHLRVPLSNSSQMPKCDICQETTGYFFCLEDRALLCRKCDVAIHTANAHVSAHQRFLLTGVKVGLETKEPVVSSAKEKKNYMKKASEIPSGTSNSRSLSSVNKDAASSQAVVNETLSASKVSFPGGSMSGFIPDWHLGEFFGLNDFNDSYGLMEQVSSKEGDGVKLGDSEWSPVYPAVAEDVDIEDYLGQVPELPWTVPEIPSPPTASGLHWPRNIQCNLSDDSLLFVPDVCHLQNGSRNQLHLANAIPSAIPNIDIYRKFTNALGVTVIVSVGCICYELYFKSTDVYNERWQTAWIIPAFWQVLSFSLLCVICALWAPSQNSMRYAYSDEANEDFEKEDTLTLIKPATLATNEAWKTSAHADTKTMQSGNGGPLNDEDLEEDKRE